MSMEFKLPELGENIETIQVTRVLVVPGDAVAAEQPLLEVETDKATIEVPGDAAGTIESVLVSDGDEVSVGQVMLTLSEGDAPAAAAAPAAAEPTPAPEPAPTPAPEPAPEPIPPPEPAPSPSPAPVAPEPPDAQGPTPYNVPAAPSVRRFAREIGIDVTQVTGTGPSGRVSIDDVKAFAKQKNESPAAAPIVTTGTGTVVVPPLPDFEKWGSIERKKMSVIRRKTAEHMSLSWSQVPHVTIFDKADITELDVLRKRYADHAADAGGKLTMAVMVCKVAAAALKRFPQFNASIDMTAKEVVLKQYVNLGVAVSTERGLVVPVIHNADRKNMVEIAAEIAELAGKAREGKIQLDDLEGGSFTVTNLGRICGTYFTPIINYPEVAILGIGRAKLEPVVRDGQVETRMMLPLSLSFDHRIIDGSDGARFLGWVIDAIQEPLLLSLQG
ncbi:MAG: 2-oxo acid dehydrogenase subunit E2 [Kiritimatiellia bacterium]|jgi:pyruvate dehydrogenase E2 component (dihydrolipoamide acetyltransferase)|nr:2-oxo acid dehydrogenase subunit E2 [Kiritimatiellia bacterium]MDP6631221.1 2-oxo acid dehydrogenase subunit E2 [Kiritimatiellia bacterium]MDP6809552.1 2-oxo acid dehydrogenase subunit E2 [Kiritimatiellia bacterium]MDP7023597.1 2-oxo acid dehydrogenase subunit E2 [Kiritimatiellia bacterium]